MKYFLILCMGLSSLGTLACEVDGISDSPQSLNCEMKDRTHVEILCVDKNYQLKVNHEKPSVVDAAFHLEVERGNSPLVFRSPLGSLQVIKEKKGYKATFQQGEASKKGRCL